MRVLHVGVGIGAILLAFVVGCASSASRGAEDTKLVDQFSNFLELGESAAARRCLKRLGDIDARDSYGFPALILSSIYKDEELIRLIIYLGGDPNVTWREGWTALHFVCNSAPDATAVRLAPLLVEKGTNASSVTAGGWTPLHCASNRGLPRTTGMQLARSVDVDPLDTEGCTPLYYAAFKGNVEVVRLLLSYGADRGMRNSDGMRPIDVALREARKASSRGAALAVDRYRDVVKLVGGP